MKKFVSLLISLLYIDFLFIFIEFNSITLGGLIRILLTNITISLLVSFIKNDKAYKIVSYVLLTILSIYSYVQLEFNNFMSTFYSFKAIEQGFAGVKGYIWYFISSSKAEYFLVLLSLLIFALLDHFLKIDDKKVNDYIYRLLHKNETKKRSKKTKPVLTIFNRILLFFILLFLTILSPLTSNINDLITAYTYNDNYELILKNTGSNHFLFKDFYSFLFPRKIEFVIENENTTLLNDTNAEDEKEETIDDSEWISLMEAETNTSIKNIDEYLLSRPTNHETKHTGEFEDCNFIYFLTESLDYIAIDENLTPTLFKMWNDGYHFTNHYTPMYSCGTGDSEFTAMTGVLPLRSVCTPYEVLNTNLHTSLAGLFKESGYNVRAFHNWNDQFYKRTQLEVAYGIDEYRDIDKLDIKLVKGWQSDVSLIENALPYFIDDDKFFTFFITSSMHWPYDESSYIGDKYVSQINEYYPDYPSDVKRYISKCMELDKALELLLNKLEEAGKLDNTVISLFSDHKPYKLNSSDIVKYSQLKDRNGRYGTDLTPFIIYNTKTRGKEIDTICSTIDHVPTIANLFNLNYDPRFYVGNDAFEDQSIVIFNNLDWITNKGSYVVSTNKSSDGLNQEYVGSINSQVKNIANISKAILQYDYFEKRKSVIYPEYK